MHSRAVSPGLRPRKSQVALAEALMRLFWTRITLGVPVEPLVCTSMVSPGSFQ